jgi:energy-coupling factor transport system substrate-specific component
MTTERIETPVVVKPAFTLRPRAALLLLVASLIGFVAFCWPLFVHQQASQNAAHGVDAPWVFVALVPLLLAIILSEISEGSLDAKAIALLGILAACGAALRIPSPGIDGFEPLWFLVILSGRVFGRGFGFVMGALVIFVSALITGGVGPWLPFEMLGGAWMGLAAGSLPRASGWREVVMLSWFAVVACLLYGMLLNLWFWPFLSQGTAWGFVPGAGPVTNLHRFLLFDLTTSLGFDIPRAVTNAVLILVLGRPVLGALRRVSKRAAFDPLISFSE